MGKTRNKKKLKEGDERWADWPGLQPNLSLENLKVFLPSHYTHIFSLFVFFATTVGEAKAKPKAYIIIIMATMAMDTNDLNMAMQEGEGVAQGGMEMNLTNESTTIDASVVASRILQSESLQQEQMQEDGEQPHFPKISAVQASGNKVEYRRVRCPPHRYTPLREHWEQILTPLVEYLKLQVCLYSSCI